MMTKDKNVRSTGKWLGEISGGRTRRVGMTS